MSPPPEGGGGAHRASPVFRLAGFAVDSPPPNLNRFGWLICSADRSDNLPETHAFLKEIRADVDERYRDRVLLAEVNQTYGDEIGMGDDLTAPDRERLRLLMRWDDVARQQGDTDSLLSQVGRLIDVRRRHRAFGRGSIEFVDCDNRRVLAICRRCGDDVILVVANLAGSSQTVSIGLPDRSQPWVTALFEGAAFDRTVGSPWALTMAPYAWRWFPLARPTATIGSN